MHDEPQFIIPLTADGTTQINAGINVRPKAVQHLKELSEIYQIVVFTASYKYYADPILDFLDPLK
jgi:TFIIF-interacting CTD phosphatase-like protein